MQIIDKQTSNILTKSKLPSADFVANPYIGCTHKCIYCYACFMQRFINVPDLPWNEFLIVKNWQQKKYKNLDNKTILLSSITDAYQPIERKFKKSHQILQELKDTSCNLEILTKSKFVLEDLALIKELNVTVGISLNTLDDAFRKTIEPNASKVLERLETLKILKSNNIKTYLFVSPIFPFITKIQDLINETKEYVDFIAFENLNLRHPYKQTVLELIKQNHYEFYEEYCNIYNNKVYFKDFWQKLSLKIIKYCNKQNVNCKIYFFHDEITK